jgi:hypothetical protein
MPAEDWEHQALVIWAEVKQTIPRQDAVKSVIKGQRTHVRNEPVLAGKTSPAHSDEGRRRVNAGHLATPIDEVAGDWLAGTAPNVENASLGRQERQHPIEPRFLKKAPSSFTIPIYRMDLIEIDYIIMVTFHLPARLPQPDGQARLNKLIGLRSCQNAKGLPALRFSMNRN